MQWTYLRVLTILVATESLVLADRSLSRQDVLNHLLNTSRYDSSIAPNFEQDTATNVTIQLFVRSIHSIREISMDFSVDIFLRQKWTDPRLVFTNMTDITRLELDQKLINKVWVPDTIFTNEKEATVHSITVPNKLMHLYQNGTVFYSARIGMTLSCHMELQKYPLDSQFCPFYMESYGYTTENLIFHWDQTNAMEITEVELPQFFIESDPYFDRCDKDYGEAGIFTCLEAGVRLKRNTGYYVIQVFVPSILIVILSWVSFWIDIDSTPARISLGVLTVLTMTTQSSGARSQLPRVSYVKAIDVWMATCLFFVFGALIEFAYANVTFRGKKKEKGLQTTIQANTDCVPNKKSFRFFKKCDDPKRRARYIDKTSRVLFPASFIIFNIVFWIYYSFAPDNNPHIT
ncbi:glycine receptor subunit alpha-3-like [Pecten maximus]|uniref:glycine receptor subunit alpha-3-like n=1 Tax=Pecten maximus TaxID=6579 RepID=UPI0014580E80|nr:glycine receptor subunit alpha-3-like [Pecten maximus]XP_033742247.1 glycine receptor subunit alpha-3-like [Pecten maximus]